MKKRKKNIFHNLIKITKNSKITILTIFENILFMMYFLKKVRLSFIFYI